MVGGYSDWRTCEGATSKRLINGILVHSEALGILLDYDRERRSIKVGSKNQFNPFETLDNCMDKVHKERNACHTKDASANGIPSRAIVFKNPWRLASQE